ncbi:protein BRI1-5 ENHANCED 1 [Humulus lupulus]|uniref:protein BRI1-5 ENHANCED 1 n=1 Tax=Humulus lupulus TaxID=3486 RepID=UPI002B401227|nr:protein BRI1-5 ENHANCED 1 [Humulus lupulus]XP_062090498.1 protein BRI1-5 ENHANCED 1 [Humulus lupulus]XP_062090499.1 protein BRI1-5 ENHANCED 1 [Humulus lupulus]
MEEEEEEGRGTCCVTGGTGYVASWLIMRLLQHGYSIRATVRSHSSSDNQRDISYLTSLPGAKERLEIMEADLDRPESFNRAIQGCVGVFHLAHPMNVDGKETEEIVTRRAVEGTLGILKACLANSDTIKRVVYTSSAVTVLFNDNGASSLNDETTWSDLEVCRRRSNNDRVSSSYLVSKTVVERTALEFAEKHGLDLVTLVIPLVVGPFICPKIPSSVYISLAMIFGDHDIYKHFVKFDMVHIDDVASAHIFFMEEHCTDNDAKARRYICSSADTTVHELFHSLSTRYPEFHISLLDDLKEIKIDKKYSSLSSVKLLKTGFKFKFGLDEMLAGAIQSCKDKGFL